MKNELRLCNVAECGTSLSDLSAGIGRLPLANRGVGSVAMVSPLSVGDSPTGAGESPALPISRMRAEVRWTENAVDESAGGVACYKIETPATTDFLEKPGAGLASMIDQVGHDWLGFHPTPGNRAGVEFRGFPNAVDNPAGSYFTPKMPAPFLPPQRSNLSRPNG